MPGEDAAFVSTELGPVLLLGGPAAGRRPPSGRAPPPQRSTRWSTPPPGASPFELRERPEPAVAVAGEPRPLLAATAEDVAAYSRAWDGGRPRRLTRLRLARHWTALLQDYLGLFLARQRPVQLLALSSRGRVLSEIYAEAARRAPGERTVPGVDRAQNAAASMAAALRQLALVVSTDAPRAAAAVEGRWQGTHRGPRPRGADVPGAASAARPAGSRGTLTTWAGSIEVRSPLRDVGFERGERALHRDLQGAAYRFKGTLESSHVKGSIERDGQAAAAVHDGVRGVAVARRVRSGLERLLDDPAPLKGRRVGLVCNPSTITPDLEHGSLALSPARAASRLVALFGPEHGIAADAQDLVEVGHSRDRATGLPVFSLYGETRVPTPAMLEGVDAMVFDVQDVGSRYYTFIYTLLHVMQACARERRRVVVLDRPNPLGGDASTATCSQREYRSFVGLHPLAVRHGMTVGELALMFREELGARTLDLVVVRDERLAPRAWPTRTRACPGCCPRPTCRPSTPRSSTRAAAWSRARTSPRAAAPRGRSSSSGAPWLDACALARALERERLPGVGFRATAFTPTFQKHAGTLCHGVQVHVHDRRRFPAFLAYLLLIHHARRTGAGALRLARPAVRVRAREAAVRHPVRDRPHPPGDRGRRLAAAAGRRLGEGSGRVPPAPREVPAVLTGRLARPEREACRRAQAPAQRREHDREHDQRATGEQRRGERLVAAPASRGTPRPPG